MGPSRTVIATPRFSVSSVDEETEDIEIEYWENIIPTCAE
jgi:hypothetical protein